MSDIEFYVDRARRANAAVARIANEVERDPNDRGLRISLSSARRLAERASADAIDIAREKHVDVVHYRLVEREGPEFRLSDVTRSLGTFQELLSQVFSSLSSAPRQRSGFSIDVRDKTTLQFGWTFAGSLGVVLLAPSEHSLFDGRFDETVGTVHSLIKKNSEEQLLDASRILGAAVINKAFEWANANITGDFDLDLQWRLSHDRMIGGLIEKPTFEAFTNIATGTSEETKTEFSMDGVLVGINIRTKTFHLVEPEGRSIKGKLSDEFNLRDEYAVNHGYQAKLLETSAVDFVTGEDKRSYSLKALREAD